MNLPIPYGRVVLNRNLIPAVSLESRDRSFEIEKSERLYKNKRIGFQLSIVTDQTLLQT